MIKMIKIIKFTKITLNNYVKLKHAGRFYLLVDFNNYDKICKQIRKKIRSSSHFCNKDSIIETCNGYSGDKIFITISGHNVLWDTISVFKIGRYTKELFFYDLTNNNKEDGKQVLKFYIGDNYII